MRDLHVVSVTADGRHAVLAARRDGGDGQFRLALDSRLAAALRGELPPSGGGLAPPPASLTVREMQARLRSGESTEQIAASAGLPVARVERFAGPVIAEREGAIRGAQLAVLSRPRRGASALPLGEAVARHLTSSPGYKPESTTWSARREDTGVWVVRLTFVARARKRTAAWRYDPTTRQVHPLDAAAADLAHVDPAGGVRVVAKGTRGAVPAVRSPRARPPRVTSLPLKAGPRRAVAPMLPAPLLPAPLLPAPLPPAHLPPVPAPAAAAAPPKRVRRPAAASPGRPAQTATPPGRPAQTATPPVRPAQTATPPGRPAQTPMPPVTPPVDPRPVEPAPSSPPLLTVVPPSSRPRRQPAAPANMPAAEASPPPNSPPPSSPPPSSPPPGQLAPPVRRAAGGRATVPAWEDVLFGAAPPGARPEAERPPD